MSEQKLPRPAGDVVDDGVPATEEVRDEVLRTGDSGVADMPMPDRPMGADEWGITDMEQSSGEPLDVRRRGGHARAGRRVARRPLTGAGRP